ncbi:MAG: GNAT family N-acetyltransferase [Flavobacteriaceae bacterium]|nr:GNAT family N-acetyltransferase [Flavobacteriaceae bacterium]
MLKNFIISKITIKNFYVETVIKRTILPFYDRVSIGSVNTTGPYEKEPVSENDLNKKIYYLTYVPPYVDLALGKDFKKIAFERFVGYSINLENYESVESYMLHQFGSKSRSKIRTYLNRLETCFNISYKTYFGQIEPDTYQHIMASLEHMISRRFNQRNDEHQAVKNWDYYKNATYNLINNKKASLFVVYDNDKPIDICLNIHYEAIYINYIRAFDIDYSKFRLGYVDILKQLEWCFEHGYKMFDLGMGIFSYKIQWCDVQYQFKNYIVYNKKSMVLALSSRLMALFYKLKLFLDKNNIVVDKAEKNQDNTNSNQVFDTDHEFDTQKINNIPINSEFLEIDIEEDTYAFLRKWVYDILYLNFEHKNKVTLYKVKNELNSYIVKGKNLYKLTPKSN